MKNSAHIRFRELMIQNFLSFGPKQTIKLSRQGLTLVEGSNGQGKSTILDALAWVLYGKPLRKLGSVDKVVNRWVERNCAVTVKLEVGGVQFEIQRYRNDSKHKNKLFIFANGKDITKKDVADEQIVTILNGLDLDTFKRVVVFSKRDLVSFAALSDGEQKKVFEKLLGVEELNEAFERAKALLRDQSQELDTLKSELAADDSMIEAHAETVRVLRDSRKAFTELKQANVDNIKKQIGEASKKVPDHSALKKDVAIEQQLLDKAVVWRRKNERKLEAAREAFDIASEERDRARTTKDGVAHMHRDLEERLDPLIGTDLCPTCEAPVDKAKKKGWRARLDKLAADTKMAEARMSAAHAKWMKADKDRNVLRQIEEKAAQRSSEHRAKLEGLKTELATARRRKQAAQEAVAGLQARLEEVQAGAWGQEADLASAKQKLGNAKALNEVRKRRVKVMTRRVKYTDFWVRGFGRAGLPTDLIDSIVPALTARAQSHLGRITQGTFKVSFDTQRTLSSGESRDKFVVHVDNADGADAYGGNSVGELARVDLAISLALQDLAAMRARCSVNVQFFDEAFDGTDPAAADSIAELLTDLARSKESLFVVTHLDTLKASFPHVLHVEKHKRFSRVVHGT